jgi:transcriptional regulator with XRE-family HTH domain
VVEQEVSILRAAGSIPAARFLSDCSAKLSDVKTVERRQARLLRRRDGCSVKEIARLVGASPSTVSLWVRDIELTAEQHEALRQRNPVYNVQLNGWKANIDKGRARRLGYQQAGRRRVAHPSGLYVAGCMLYWAEGDKKRNSVRLSNADPELVRLFVEFLRECFGVLNDDIRGRATSSQIT